MDATRQLPFSGGYGMLPRMLEPELMDTREDAWDYDSMDHAEVNRRFVKDLLAAGLSPVSAVSSTPPHSGPLSDGPEEEAEPLLVLDIGTGTAQIPILLCQATDEVRVIAADAAVSMLDLARLNIEIAGVRERIQLDRSDAKQMPYRDAMFDAVISNSIVHHIPEPRGVLREAVRVTQPGGLLFFRDLMRPADEEEVDQLVKTYAANCNEHQQMLFRNSLHAALTLDEMQALVGELGFSAESVEVTSDRHWTWCARRA
ncbi:MAG: class I SAM-dependent methyltransferase [Pirellulales bacterium]